MNSRDNGLRVGWAFLSVFMIQGALMKKMKPKVKWTLREFFTDPVWTVAFWFELTYSRVSRLSVVSSLRSWVSKHWGGSARLSFCRSFSASGHFSEVGPLECAGLNASAYGWLGPQFFSGWVTVTCVLSRSSSVAWCRNDRDGPHDLYRHCTTVPNTHFSRPQDWHTIMCRQLVERNTVAWSPGSAAACSAWLTVWVWLHKGKACDEERGWTGASSCVWSRPTVPYHEAGHLMFLGQMWVSTFQAPLQVLGKTFCGSVGNRMIRGWMSVQFSSAFKMVSMRSEKPIFALPRLSESSVLSVAFETVAFSRPFKQDRQALLLSTPLSSRRSIVWWPWLSARR